MRPGASRAFAALVCAALAALSFTAPARAQTFSLPEAHVAVTLAPDGSLQVEERLTVAFAGRFTFGFRDVPLREGERLDEVAVLEGGRAYRPGSATPEPDLEPDTFGSARTSEGVKFVWHFRATDEVRTFTIRYRLSGLAIAYDDSSTSISRSGATSGMSAWGG